MLELLLSLLRLAQLGLPGVFGEFEKKEDRIIQIQFHFQQNHNWGMSGIFYQRYQVYKDH